jgi:hypothetical protein
VEIIAAVVVIGVFVLFLKAGEVAAAGTETAFAAYFRGWKPDPWPHGVQEEYIERPWGSSQPEASPSGAGFAGRRPDAEPPAGEIVDFFPARRPETVKGGLAAVGRAPAIGASAAGSADPRDALATQRVRSHRLRSRL